MARGTSGRDERCIRGSVLEVGEKRSVGKLCLRKKLKMNNQVKLFGFGLD